MPAVGSVERRPTSPGLALSAIVSLAMLGASIGPIYTFWPNFAVPGPAIVNITLLTYALPALLLFAVGWYLQQDARPSTRYFGIAQSIFAVGVVYPLVLVDIRRAWNLGAPTLIGPTSQSEFYAYSIATLIFGILLMVLPAPRRQGVELRFRARGHRESLPVRRRSLDRAVAGPELPVDGPQFPWDFLGLRAVRVRYRPAQTKGGRKAALSLRNPRDAYISAP